MAACRRIALQGCRLAASTEGNGAGGAYARDALRRGGIVGNEDAVGVATGEFPSVFRILRLIFCAYGHVAVVACTLLILQVITIELHGVACRSVVQFQDGVRRIVAIAYKDIFTGTEIADINIATAAVLGIIGCLVVGIAAHQRGVDFERHFQRFGIADRSVSRGTGGAVAAHNGIFPVLQGMELARTSVATLADDIGFLLSMKAQVERCHMVVGIKVTHPVWFVLFFVKHKPHQSRIGSSSRQIDIHRLAGCYLHDAIHTDEVTLHVFIGDFISSKCQVDVLLRFRCKGEVFLLNTRQHLRAVAQVDDSQVVGVGVAEACFVVVGSILGTVINPFVSGSVLNGIGQVIRFGVVCAIVYLRQAMGDADWLVGRRLNRTDYGVFRRLGRGKLRACRRTVIHQTVVHLQVVGYLTIDTNYSALGIGDGRCGCVVVAHKHVTISRQVHIGVQRLRTVGRLRKFCAITGITLCILQGEVIAEVRGIRCTRTRWKIRLSSCSLHHKANFTLVIHNVIDCVDSPHLCNSC